VSKQDMVKALETYFAGRDEVRLAFLFGSAASDRMGRMSDVDVAVYLDAEGDAVEDSLQTDLERLLKREVDLVVLNRAPATLSWTAIRKGAAVKIQSRKFFLDFMLNVSTEADDFLDFNLDARRRRDDRERLAGIADSVPGELVDIKAEFLRVDRQTYETDRDVRRNLERCVENIVNASLDMAKILLVADNLPIPDTYRQYFEALCTAGVIRQDASQAMGHGVTLRNVLAHHYLDIRWRSLSRFLSTDWPHYEAFLEIVRQRIRMS